MSEPATLRVFVDGRGIDLARGATVLDAVRVADAGAADAVVRGEKRVTDSRGLGVEPSEPAFSGAIYRLAAVRARR